MSATLLGASSWSMTTDAEGHRTYKICWKVTTDNQNDGPFVVSQCPGLPLVGSFWLFGNDVDNSAFCLPTQDVKPNSAVKPDNPVRDWVVDQTFSTKPVDPTRQRCNDTKIEDPLLEPMKMSGSFVQFTEEAVADRFGNPILSSSWELFRGPQNEWDNYRASVEIEQNVAVLDLETVGYILNNPLNNVTLWGVIPRGVKLSRFSWERKYFGSCYVYFTRKFGFDVNIRKHPTTGNIVSGWDRDIQDAGTKVLSGHWDTDAGSGTFGQWVLDNVGSSTPDPMNPQHFIRFTDKLGNPANVLLDGKGQPAGGSYAPSKGPPFIMSIIAASQHLPGDTQDNTAWATLRTDPTNVPAWVGSTKFVYGALRTYIGNTWFQSKPAGSTGTPGTSSDWIAVTLTDKSPYDGITAFDTYGLGDYVSLVIDVPTGVGTRHVEKYGESNLFYLNIPLFLG